MTTPTSAGDLFAEQNTPKRFVLYHILTSPIDMAKTKSIVNTMSSCDFVKLVENSTSVREVLIKLGFSGASGSMAKVVKDRIVRESLDVSHFKKGGTRGGMPRHSLEEILVENSTYTNIGCLKGKLVRSGLLKYECSGCGNKGEWLGKPLTLQLEHKNGKHNDHRIENLTFLCPNCHSQTKTFSGRNADKTKVWI